MFKWKRSLTVLAMTALLGTMAACGGNGNGATNKAEPTNEPASTAAAANGCAQQ